KNRQTSPTEAACPPCSGRDVVETSRSEHRGAVSHFNFRSPIVQRGHLVKRILRLSTLSGAIVASIMLASISPLSLQTAEAQLRGLTIYGGGYGQGYGGYSGYGGGYGYSPYGRGAYTY